MVRVPGLRLAALLLCLPAVAAELHPAESLEHWIDAGLVPDTPAHVQPVESTLLQDNELPLTYTSAVVGLAIHGEASLDSPRAFVRAILVDAELKQHLVVELYPMMVGEGPVPLVGACRETCLLDGVQPHRLIVQVHDAELRLETIESREAPLVPSASPAQAVADSGSIADGQAAIFSAQAAVDVARLNARIDAEGLQWMAGYTGPSALYFEQRRARHADGDVPVLHGFEYYAGGVFELPSHPRPVSLGSQFVSRFDWRQRHDAHRSSSPYYDGDPDGGGWMTAVREQACGDCWAFATVAVTEGLVNLHLNRHEDPDLSEQHVLSCSGAGDCGGGSVGLALAHAENYGLMSEPCCPYQGYDYICAGCCTVPELTASIGGILHVTLGQEDDVKAALIAHGPVTFGVRSWLHAMVLVGYETDPADQAPVWILKNQWGTDWGEHGYGRLKIPLDDMLAVYAIETVQLSRNGTAISGWCRDADRDGYAAWGLREPQPTGCASIDGRQDCNDADPSLGPALANGACAVISVPPDDPPAPGGGGGGGGGAVATAAMVILGAGAILTHRAYRG